MYVCLCVCPRLWTRCWSNNSADFCVYQMIAFCAGSNTFLNNDLRSDVKVTVTFCRYFILKFSVNFPMFLKSVLYGNSMQNGILGEKRTNRPSTLKHSYSCWMDSERSIFIYPWRSIKHWSHYMMIYIFKVPHGHPT